MKLTPFVRHNSNERGLFMSKGKRMYSVDLKLEIVLRYLNAEFTQKELSEIYGMSQSDVQKWKDAYLAHGIEGLCVKNGTYTGDFKVSVVEYMNNTGASIRSTAAHFNIPSYTSVSQWKRIYNEQGKEALYNENRGRNGTVKEEKALKSNKKTIQPKENITTTDKALLEEVKRLRMENEYLKKLNALIREKEK